MTSTTAAMARANPIPTNQGRIWPRSTPRAGARARPAIPSIKIASSPVTRSDTIDTAEAVLLTPDIAQRDPFYNLAANLPRKHQVVEHSHKAQTQQPPVAQVRAGAGKQRSPFPCVDEPGSKGYHDSK